jgi:uncharacterized membrane protein
VSDDLELVRTAGGLDLVPHDPIGLIALLLERQNVDEGAVVIVEAHLDTRGVAARPNVEDQAVCRHPARRITVDR